MRARTSFLFPHPVKSQLPLGGLYNSLFCLVFRVGAVFFSPRSNKRGISTEESDNEADKQDSLKLKTSEFAFLKTDAGPVGLGSFLTEIEKLKRIRTVGLPPDLFAGISPKLIKTYRHRAATETPYHLRQHPPAIRYTLMAAFCLQRSQEITDNLIDLLMSIIQRIDTRAERRINKELVSNFKEITGKTNLLFRIAEVAVAEPAGVIEKVIYPVVSQKTLG